jgi:hypothetical protein
MVDWLTNLVPALNGFRQGVSGAYLRVPSRSHSGNAFCGSNRPEGPEGTLSRKGLTIRLDSTQVDRRCSAKWSGWIFQREAGSRLLRVVDDPLGTLLKFISAREACFVQVDRLRIA